MTLAAATAALLLAAAAPVRDQPADALQGVPDAPQAQGRAEPKSFTATVSPEKVRLGEQFLYTIEIRHRASERYELPPGLSLGKDVDVIKVDAAREGTGDDRVTRFTLAASLFALGEQTLADLELPVTTPQGQLKLTVPGAKLAAEGDIKEEEKAELYDIQAPVEVSVPRYERLLIALGILGAMAVGFFLWRWYRNRPVPLPTELVAPPVPLFPRTLAALEALQREDLPGQGRVKEFHFRLSEIVRGYLGERFGFFAIDQTTEELLGALSRISTPGLDYARFEAFCREGDLVKYAKAEANQATCKAAIELAFQFVRSTEPPPEAPKPRPSSTQGAAA